MSNDTYHLDRHSRSVSIPIRPEYREAIERTRQTLGPAYASMHAYVLYEPTDEDREESHKRMMAAGAAYGRKVDEAYNAMVMKVLEPTQ